MHVLTRSRARTVLVSISSVCVLSAVLVSPAHAKTGPDHGGAQSSMSSLKRLSDTYLAPRTTFAMQPDGSSGAIPDGADIPNIDSVKSTIRTYYNAPSGIANKTTSPYITQLTALLKQQQNKLPSLLAKAKKSGKKPAIVFDADDTTLWTYDMEDAAMHFNYDPTLQNTWVQNEQFPAVPAMVDFEKKASSMGFTIIGITGRSAAQKDATLGNLAKVGYTGFTSANYYTKWATGQQPSYINCATVSCTTVEFKAGTRKHLQAQGYDIALNIGDQWSDLQGGSADTYLKLPNPTYYLPSPDLPGMNEPKLAPRTRFTMKPDGSSGRTVGGEGIPNIDSVKSTIRTYYNAPSGIASKTNSPYLTEMSRLTKTATPLLTSACAATNRFGLKPAIVLDADDTTLWTYDMEDGAMHFNYDPTLQNTWVQNEQFPAVPGMVALANAASKAGCTIVGITGRSAAQKDATLGNLAKVGYTGFTSANYYTKWATGQQPSYISCATASCTTIEYKSQTRAHVESASGGHYTILANFGDQFSDLIGGHALVPVKLPNPTYYLP